MPIYSVNQIVSHIQGLRPDAAVAHGQIAEHLCCSPIIDKLDIDGEIIDLDYNNDKEHPRYAVGYLRVSTLSQQESGFSVYDQARNMVTYFAQKRLAFRLISDAGLSGSLPYSDQHLINRMIDLRTSIYKDVFTAVFLSPSRIQTYTQREESSVRAYLAKQIAKIKKSQPLVQLELRPRAKQKLTFRPGLTLLTRNLQDTHMVLISDLSRLSRNQYLFSQIMTEFGNNQVIVEGLMEHLDFLNARAGYSGFGNDLQAFVLSKMAEMRLYETLIGSMRGLLARLESGRKIGRAPMWLHVIDPDTDNEHIEFKPRGREIVEKLISLYVDEGLGPYEVMSKLNSLGMKCPSELGIWTLDLFNSVVTSRALLGFRSNFGREFPIYPPIINEERWAQIESRHNNKDINRFVHNYDWQLHRMSSPVKYMATSLFRCHCAGTHVKGRGGTLTFQPNNIKNSSGYICGCARRNKGVVHIRVSEENAHEFIDDLMCSDPSMFLQQFQSREEYKQLQSLLMSIDKEAIKLGMEVDKARISAEVDAKADVATLKIDPSNPGYTQAVASLIETKLWDNPITKLLQAKKHEHQSILRKITMYVPSHNNDSLEQRIRNWRSLDANEKNHILLTLFETWYFRRLNDDDTNLEMVMVLRNGQELPPVRIDVTRRKTKIWRRLPSVDTWMGQVIDDAQRNTQNGQI